MGRPWNPDSWFPASCGALLMLTATSPVEQRITLDRSVFGDEGCLAPSGDSCAVAMSGEEDPSPLPSASTALLAPSSPAAPWQSLKVELAGLLDFGPEIAFSRRDRMLPDVTVAPARMVCLSRGRHRPDRSFCKPAVRTRR